ncbi:MAG: DUF6635 family protein [Nitrospira sp.]|nr:MAG: hypothetical protein E8D44_00275 [Nitrospira sp.]
MTAQNAAIAVAVIEDCIDRYIAECHGRVDGFVKRHFSLQETIALQKQSFAGDLLCHPVNTLWAIPYLLLKKVVEVPEKLGWHVGADLVGLLPSGIKTRYQKEVERLIATELLAWPCGGGTGVTIPQGLAEMLKRDRSVVPRFASEASVEAALKDLPDITKLLESHSSSRGLVCDMAATVLTLMMGWMLFGDHSLGIAGIGDQIARKAARDRAASHFVLGAGLGSAFYSLFPPKPSVWQVVWATLCVGLFVTCMSLLAGMFSDPWLKRTGLQQAQLHRLIDAMEERLHLHVRKRIKPAVKQMAA